MNLFENLKKITVRARCGIGIHSGTFKPMDGKPQCNIGKICPDCNMFFTKTKHNFSPWSDYIKPKSCVVVQRCIYCEESRTRKNHPGFIRKGVDDHCHVILSCARCGEVKKGKQVHKWEKELNNKSNTVERCQQCGKEKNEKY